MRNPGLEYLSVFGLEPTAFIHLAAQMGLDAVGLNINGPSNPLTKCDIPDLRSDPAARAAITAALRDTGVTLALVEGFTVAPGRSAADLAADLDHVAAMGARSVCAVSVERDRPRGTAELRILTELAAQRGLIVTTEVGAGVARTLAAALDMTAAVDHPSFGLLIDTMHFFRSGATVADFAAIDPMLIRHVQLCDAPMPAIMENYMEEALFERRAPGDGDLPLAALVPHIPEHAGIGLEIPQRSLAEAGVGHRARLDACLVGARRLWSDRG